MNNVLKFPPDPPAEFDGELVLRLSGGSLEAMAEQIGRQPGETLQ